VIILRIGYAVNAQIFDLEIRTLNFSTLGPRRDRKTHGHVRYTIGTGFDHRKIQKYAQKITTHA